MRSLLAYQDLIDERPGLHGLFGDPIGQHSQVHGTHPHVSAAGRKRVNIGSALGTAMEDLPSAVRMGWSLIQPITIWGFGASTMKLPLIQFRRN